MTRTANARLALGTVQLGLPYGAANASGLPAEAEAVALIQAAVQAGVTTIDTARAYGDAERRIGLALPPPSPVQIVTKLDPLAQVSAEAPAADAVAAARASLSASRAALRRDRLDTVLLHRASHRSAWSGAVWDMLRTERNAGRIACLGISAQTPEELGPAIADRDVAHVQLPFNLLDWRWQQAGFAERLRARRDLTVHVRSIFLQGLLAGAAPARWPALPGVEPAALIGSLNALAKELKRASLADLALAFVRGQDWIDGVVIGMETRDQLMDNIVLFARPPLSASEIARVRSEAPRADPRLLDPARWPSTERM